MFVFFVLMIGLRHKVGGDWNTYLANLNANSGLTFTEAISGSLGDPGDGMLNWIAIQSGMGIYLVNCVYAVIFTWGLLVFCRNQPRPWLALTLAVPYLTTVVAMGYTRQGGAIGLVMLGLVALADKKILKFVFVIALAATFHKSALILMPLAVLASTKSRIFVIFWVAVTAFLLFGLLLQEHIERLRINYIEAQYESAGAAVRIAMNAIPASLFLLMRRRFILTGDMRIFWTWMSWGALGFVALLYISPSSTAVDRVALYWIPLQLFVLSRVPEAMSRQSPANTAWVFTIVIYSATVHFVWLFFGIHAAGWLPYKFYPWVWLWQ
jgi:hypothetical protein